ncbi:MAG: hypothetical protein GY720_04665 [bacterium]|nr:hypothetical protein [bacterium]
MDDTTRLTDIGSITLRADGILYVVFDFDGVMTEELASEYLAVRNGLVGDTSPPVLLHIITFPYVERSLRVFLLAGLPHPPCRAVVSADPTFITLWRTYQMVSEVDIPSRVFANLELAADWLHEQVAESERKGA